MFLTKIPRATCSPRRIATRHAFNIAIALLIGFISEQGLQAQAPAPSPKPSMYFRTLGVDCNAEGLNYLLGSNSVPLTIVQGVRSQPFEYSGPSPLEIFRTVTGPDGKLARQQVASIDISQAGTYPLLMFFKGTKGPDQPVISLLKEDAKSFPSGTFRIVNYSRLPLSANLPGGLVAVPAGTIKDYLGKEGGIFTVGISENNPSGPFLAFNSNIGILPGGRIMFLVLPPPSSERHIQILRLTDSAPVP